MSRTGEGRADGERDAGLDLPLALVVLSVGFGALVRAVQYAHRRSLWVDEALLANALTSLPLAELSEGLRANQVAPPGFLVTSKAVVGLLGDGELALRLFPFVSSLLALALLYPGLRDLVGRAAAAVATALFAVSGPAIYYAVEFKQYSTEILVAVVWLWALGRALREGFTTRSAVVLSAVGVAAVLFSFTSVLLIAATAVPTLILAHRAGRRRAVGTLSVALAPAALTFAAVWVTFVVGSIDQDFMRAYWHRSFLPFPPTSLSAVRTWLGVPWRLFPDVGIPSAGLGLFAALAGAVALWRRSAGALAVLAAPLVMAVAIAAAELYPLGGRLALYLAPVVMGLVGAGVAALAGRWRAAAAILLVLLAFDPVLSAAERVVRPRDREEVRTVLEEVAASSDAGTGLYVHWSARPAFEYYRERLPLEHLRVAVGRYPDLPSLAVPAETSAPLRDFEEALEVVGSESWFLFAGGWDGGAITLDVLRERGQVVDSVRARGARAYRVLLQEEAGS